MKKLFSVTLLISLITATHAAFAMKVEEHNKSEVTSLAVKGEGPALGEANAIAIIQTLQGGGGNEEGRNITPSILNIILANAQQEFPENKLDPELQAYLLKLAVSKRLGKKIAKISNIHIRPLENDDPFAGFYQYKVHFSKPQSESVEKIILTNKKTWTAQSIEFGGKQEYWILSREREGYQKQIGFLNTIWKTHKKGKLHELDETDKKKFKLLPQFTQEALKKFVFYTDKSQNNLEPTTPCTCTIL